MVKWEAKKCNMDKRVNTYSIPGVSEVIYSKEWKKKHKKSLFDKIKRLF